MKPCKKCERGIHDEQLDANDGFCGDCKPVDPSKAPASKVTKADASLGVSGRE